MDDILAKVGVDEAKAFMDDVTIWGTAQEWRRLWDHTLRVLAGLTEAGFMLNLQKCKFLVPSAVVLGYQLFSGGYQLSGKFLDKWNALEVPGTLRDL